MKQKTILSCIYIFSLLTISNAYTMMEMAVMMGAQQGASVANEAISEMFQDISQSVMKEQSSLQNSMKSFTSNAIAAQQQDAKFLYKVFEQAFKQVGNQENKTSQYSKKMQEYIFKMVSLYQPQFYYLLSNAILFDQAFTHGTMFTPVGPIWKNVFVKGNWEYDQTTDSFWQLAREPMFSSKSDSNSSNPLQASYNSIFTEYIAHAKSYEIQCEMTLYSIEYPFFAGIMFNKNRWISGNTDSLTKCRLLGIAGYNKNDFGVYFTEQYVKQKQQALKSKNSAANNTPSINVLYPLNQIAEKEAKNIQPVSPKLFTNLQASPATFVIRIVTSAKTVQCKVWQKGTKEPKDFITIQSNNPDIYLYHSIGFMSPGAIAEFKLLKPNDLLFSQDAKNDYMQEIDNLTQSFTSTIKAG